MSEPLKIIKGKTFTLVIRWETLPLVFKAISAITKAAGPVVTAAAHGIPDGWPVAVVSALGMRQINAKNFPPYDDEFHQATLLSSSTISLNEVNSSEYSTYTSGGYLVYYTPVALSGMLARCQIRLTEDADDYLVSLTQASGITINDTTKTITITISATATAALDVVTDAQIEVEAEDGTGVVTQLLRTSISIEEEIVHV